MIEANAASFLTWVLLFLAVGGIFAYHYTNTLPPKRFWRLGIDAQIPIILPFVIPYILFYPFLLLTSGVLFLSPYLQQYLLSIVFAVYASATIWFFTRSGIERPTFTPQGTLGKILAFVYDHDGPGNAFPSSHVFLSLIAGFFLVAFFPQYAVWLWFFWLSIIFATIFTKQHYLVDIVGGGLVAALAIFISHSVLG